MHAHYSDILEQGKVRRDFLYATRCEADDDESAVPGGTLERRVDHPDRVVNDVGAVSAGNLGDLLLPPLLVVIDRIVGTEPLRDVEFGGGARGGDDLRAERLGDLDGGESDCTVSTVRSG